MKKQINITADDIKTLIKNKHYKDFAIEECKTGPTWGNNNMRKFDVWVMKKSWSNMSCIGYEVKVSRSDFLQDNKWQEYLEYCNEFSFVCPTGLILPEELTEGVGLYYVSKTGTKLFCKRKAAFTNKTIPVEIFLYILMCRVTIQENAFVNYKPPSKKKYWEEWLKEKKFNRDFGYSVSRSISKTIEDEIEKTQRENERLNNQLESVEEARVAIEKLGFTWKNITGWRFKDNLADKIKELQSGIPEGLEGYLQNTIRGINNIKNTFFPKKEDNIEQKDS